jgi:mRNA-degrading endonuclease RelE of RelBE toxin-antitoxin system
MSYKIEILSTFQKEAKKLIKKYPSLVNELKELNHELRANPNLGTTIGNHCYKIRLKIASKGKGKSGGARIITHVYVLNETVYL